MISINTVDSEAAVKTVQIQISWLLMEPSDLDLHCFLKGICEPQNDISNNVVCATSKVSDQPAHYEPRHDISCAVQIQISWLLMEPSDLDLHCFLKGICELRKDISNNVVCVTIKVSDQPAHTRSLIRAFAGRLNIL